MIDYKTLLVLFDAVERAEEMAFAASKPWKEAAYKVARETKGLEGHGEVCFEKTRFRIACQGTGIYSDETWWEDFPVEPLLAEMEKAGGCSHSNPTGFIGPCRACGDE